MTTAQVPQRTLHDVGSPGVRSAQPLGRLRAVILLAGILRQTPFHVGVGRSLMDLPVDAGVTILSHWLGHVEALAKVAELGDLPLRVRLDQTSLQPVLQGHAGRVRVQIERDHVELRGTGGVLRDVATEYADDDLLLVANGAQVLLDGLAGLAERLAETDAGVAILSLPDHSPAGVMLIRCAALREISEIGFVDMKEQALPAIARKHRVTVVRGAVDRHPVRTMHDYLVAVRSGYRRRNSGAACEDAFAEEWRSSFALAEPGAVVGQVSVLHDSVVLRGATVGEGAVVVRSLVCPGAIVSPGQTIVDELVV